MKTLKKLIMFARFPARACGYTTLRRIYQIQFPARIDPRDLHCDAPDVVLPRIPHVTLSLRTFSYQIISQTRIIEHSREYADIN